MSAFSSKGDDSMAISIGDLIRFTVFQTLYSENIQNIWYYEVNNMNGVAGLSNLVTAFIDDLISDWTPVVTEDVIFDRLLAENLTNGLDFEDVGLDFTGDLALVAANSATAVSMKLNVSTRETRPGGKRISGIPEDRISGNTFIKTVEAWNVFEAGVGLGISWVDSPPDNSIFAAPMVIGTDPITKKLDLERFQRINNGDVRSTVTTQASRRAGHGT